MFSTSGSKAHSARKRLISATYSKSTLASSPALAAQTSSILYERLLPALAAPLAHPTEPGVLNIYALLSAATMDIVTGYLFGLRSSSKFLLDAKARDRFLDYYNSRVGFSFWGQEHPQLTAWVQQWLNIRLSPAFVDTANAEIEHWTFRMCKSAADVLHASTEKKIEIEKVEDTPTVYAQLLTSISATPTPTMTQNVHLTTASELLDHLAAGFDTSSITLVYAIHELSQRPLVQAALHAELLTLSTPIQASSAPALPAPKDVDALPLLHAIVWETLRLHPAIPGPQPRVTPAGGTKLGPEGVWVPGGVRVSASAGLLHLNEDAFERATEWVPGRWVEGVEHGKVERARRREMDRWFWAFGSGGRMCVGSHLAVFRKSSSVLFSWFGCVVRKGGVWTCHFLLLRISILRSCSADVGCAEMKHILAALYTNYTTSIVDDTGIEQRDAYTAPPTSHSLLIKLTPVALT
jgi:cytochrome P450